MKKNLVRVLRSPFLTKMAFVVAVLAVLIASASCKHDKGGDNPKPNPKVEEVTLTFKMGANVTKVEPANVKVEKGKAIKLSELKAKITKMEFAKNYEFSKLCVGAENGAEITDATPLKPTTNTDIFVVAKKKGSNPPSPQPSDVALASVKVGSNPVTVADEMDAGSITDAEVDVEFATTPTDATLSFAPALKSYDGTTKKGKWALNNGDNSVKITVTKDTKTKEYTLKLKKLAEDEPILTSLKVGDDVILIKEDPEAMTVTVEADKDKVKVEYAANAGSTVATTPNIASGSDWSLECGENTLKFAVTKGSKARNYTLKITRSIELKTVKVDGNSITPIADEMTATETEKEEVPVEFTTDPADATLTFDPANAIKDYDATSKSGKWALALGLNTLKVKIVKDTGSKEYTLKITREKPTPKITSITIGPHKKDGEGIVRYNESNPKIVELPVPVVLQGVEYKIEVETDMPGAQVEYDAEDPTLKAALETGKVKFGVVSSKDDLEKVFTIKVKKDDVESNYKIKALMMVDVVGFTGARYMGEDSSASLNTIKKILKHENVSMTMYGDVAAIALGSRTYAWKTIRINNEDAKINLTPGTGYQAFGRKFLPLKLGESTEVEIIASNSEWEDGKEGNPGKFTEPHLATEVFKFTIDCSAVKADAFIEKVLVDNKVITGDDNDDGPFMALFEEDSIEEISSANPATIDVVLSRAVKSVKIGDTTINEADLREGVDEGGTVYHAKVENIAVPASGKEVTIVVTPKDEDANYRVTTMKMKLVTQSQNLPQLLPTPYVCEINGTNISYDFRKALEQDKNPSYAVDVNRLMMKFEFSKKPKKVEIDVDGETTSAEGADIEEGLSHDYYVYLDVAINNTEKQVKLTFEPEDKTINSTGVWKFKITGTNEKPKLMPVFEEISKDTELKDFLDKLKKGLVPVHKVSGTEAELVISLTEYEHDFLLKANGIKVNDVAVKKAEFALDSSSYPYLWKLKKTISNLTTTATDVKIEFLARENVADNVVWNFKLLTGGEKPSIPSKFMKFGVNDYGSDGLAFTDEFMQAVKSDKPPMLELYGKNVKVFFASAFKEYLKKVKFKIDSEPEVVKEAEGEYNFRAEHIFEGLEKDSEHTITATVVPTSENYKETEYKFKVKILSELEVPKDTYEFSIDGTERPNGYKATLERDFATLEFRVYGELVETVKMGKEGELNNVNMTPFPTTSGKKVYTCHYNIDLSIDNDENWIIEVTPKEQDKYPIVKCKYILKGRVKTDENNASFVLNNVGKPNVTPKVTRRDGINNTGVDDYGAISVDFEAYTMAKGSTVKAIRIHTFKDTDMPDESAIGLKRDGNSRKVTGKVDAYTDKPTKVKVWVIAKDGATQDETNGVYKITLNPIPLWWSYRNIKTTDKAKPAYAEIKISKAKVRKDGKIYVFFAPFKEYYGFNVALDATSEGQTELEKLGNFGYTQELFRTSLNVKDMKVGDTKEVWCKLVHTKTGIEGLTYKVKVVMEN